MLGEGAAAQVVRARDLRLQRQVALKLLKRGGPVADPARFMAEARALAMLRHPHVIEVYDYGAPADGLPFLVLELATGGSLRDHCEPDGIPPEEVCALGLDLAGALAEAHGAGILHRDLKAENVLLEADGTAKLTDFGLAKFADSGVRTHSGLVFGTPEYMAPEVMDGRAATPASDVYSFGCLLYHMVNGRPPHVGSLTEIYRARSSGHLEHRRETGLLQLAIRRCLEVAPEERASLEEVRALLRGEAPARMAARNARELDAAELAPKEHGPATRRSRIRLLAGFAGTAVLALVLLTAWPAAPPPRDHPGTPGSEPGWDVPKDAARRWRARVREIDVPAAIERLHRIGFGERQGKDAEGFQREMLSARRGRPADAHLAKLEEGLASLPYRAELDSERAQLTEVLLDRGLPFTRRRDLFETLQELSTLDAYAASWGLPEPYGVAAVIRVLVPAQASGSFEPPVEGTGPAGPGSTLLFRWKREVDREWPMLVPQVSSDDLSHQQNLGWGVIIAGSGGRWKPRNHERIHATFDLALAPAEVRAARLRIQVRNLDLPNSLRLIFNATVIDLYPPAWKSNRDRYDPQARDPWSLEVDLPVESLRPEGNSVELRHRFLPGLQAISSFDVLHVALALEARSS